MTVNEYVELHIPKIINICGKRDDLHQIGIIGCFKSFEQGIADPTKCIENEIKVFLEAQSKFVK